MRAQASTSGNGSPIVLVAAALQLTAQGNSALAAAMLGSPDKTNTAAIALALANDACLCALTFNHAQDTHRGGGGRWAASPSNTADQHKYFNCPMQAQDGPQLQLAGLYIFGRKLRSLPAVVGS
jgi:hypothetical protein